MTLFELYGLKADENTRIAVCVTLTRPHRIAVVELPLMAETFTKVIGDCKVESFDIKNDFAEGFFVMNAHIDISDEQLRCYYEMTSEAEEDEDLHECDPEVWKETKKVLEEYFNR